jgi:uncharacterized membrane-anchored protein
MHKVALFTAFLALFVVGAAHSQDSTDPKVEQFRNKLRALDWVSGPRSVTVSSNSTLQLPEGYVYLDAANTTKFSELNENFSSGKEVMVAPRSLAWTAYLEFSDDGYVKDDEKIDAAAILKSLKDGTEASNEERRRRGWPDLHVVGWNIPPAYNNSTKRLEWATLLRSDRAESSNFFTKILGRRGVTTVVLASQPDDTQAAVADLDHMLTTYRFNAGETYAEWRPGDKVAEYGLTGLILGGAVAAAVKTGLLKGFWKVLVAGAVAFWKVIAVGAAAAFASLKSLFKRKQSPL